MRLCSIIDGFLHATVGRGGPTLNFVVFVVSAVFLVTRAVDAAGHPEITVVPVGPAQLTSGTQEVSYRLPMGPEGPLPQPVVLVARQPRLATLQGPVQPDDLAPDAEEPKVPVFAALEFTVAGRQLPVWKLEEHATAYVINLDTVKSNPQYNVNRLAMKVDVKTSAPDVRLTLLGMPDPLLLDSSTNGPLIDLAHAAQDPEVKAYFSALAMEVAGDREAAREAYLKLRTAGSRRVGRFARRGLRMLSHQLRRWPLTGNFMEHYRWGLYLQQCGLFSAAFAEFDECRIIFPWHADCQFRAGELLDRTGGPPMRVFDFMDRTSEAAAVTNPNDWYALVVILRSRGGLSLSGEEIRLIKDHWLAVEQTVGAASGGIVRIITSFFVVEDEQTQAYTMRDGYLMPRDDLVQVRGWFDGVISVVPRLPDEAGKPSHTFGGDEGPNGAALSCLFSDVRWQDLLEAWYDQAAWAMEVSETGRGVPLAGQAAAYGHQPAPHKGYGYRAALRYSFTPAMFRWLKITDRGASDTFVTLWKIDGPYPIQGAPPDRGLPDHHVLDPVPSASAPKTVHLVSERDFIDLAKLFPGAGWARAQATTWVFSPQDQDVRMWLGQNDGMAMWINGRCVREGRTYSAGKYEDRNLVDTIASHAELKKGWNEVRVVVESWPKPRDKGWGFSVRLSASDDGPIPGLACTNRRPDKDLAPRYTPPKVGPYYSWPLVRGNYHDELPSLGAAELENLTGVKGLHIIGSVDKFDGYVAITAPQRAGPPGSPAYRSLVKPWQIGTDRDVVLNNVLDWAREACAAYRYQKDGKVRDLLILKPLAAEAFLTLLNEPASAAELFGKRPPAGRLLGTVTVPAGPSPRTLLVVDTLLGDENDVGRTVWPADEEDLLTPLGAYVPNEVLVPSGPPADR